MNKIICWIWLIESCSIDCVKIRPLLDKFLSVEVIYQVKDFSKIDFLTTFEKVRLQNKSLINAEKIYLRAVECGMTFIDWDSPDYPPLLREIAYPPYLLYAMGFIPDWNNIFTIGIVGTRKASAYGIDVTKRLTRDLVNGGMTIVSGFAIGIDGAATETSVNMGKSTIAVMGCGLDVIYPKGHEWLREELLKNGLFLSEYPPGTAALGWHFPIRNRIIAGLSRGVLVPEAPFKSGALITATYALESGREVFAVPANITSYNSVGSNSLIKDGAKIVMNALDVFEEYPGFKDIEDSIRNAIKRAKIKVNSKQPAKVAEPKNTPIIDNQNSAENKKEYKGIDAKIMNLLLYDDLNVDEIANRLDISINDCNTQCFMLEINGDIQKLPGNYYHIK